MMEIFDLKTGEALDFQKAVMSVHLQNQLEDLELEQLKMIASGAKKLKVKVARKIDYFY